MSDRTATLSDRTASQHTAAGQHLLSVENLTVELDTPKGIVRPVNGVTLRVLQGQAAALVGESGSGKSMTARAIMGLIPENLGGISSGSVMFQGKDLASLGKREMNHIRGRDIAMVFQDPMAYLNPTMKVTRQIGEALRMHKGRGSDTREEIARILRSVGLDDGDKMFSSYPHHLSGGMRQRALMAIALACDPDLLIADEPTTALDVTIQAQVLQTMSDIQKNTGLGVLFITHDLSVVAQMCDYIYVMYQGEIVEQNDVFSLFESPQHPYTQRLLDSALSIESENVATPKRKRAQTAEPARVAERAAAAGEAGSGAPALLKGEELKKYFVQRHRMASTKPAVGGVTIHIDAGETLALVGESGSGKSTTARMMADLVTPTVGRVLFEGKPLRGFARNDYAVYRRQVQVVFQDPMSSFNPRRSVHKTLRLPIRKHRIVPRGQEDDYIRSLLEMVELNPVESYWNRMPGTLSGGQRQRLALARAMALKPSIIVADEPLSALDVSIQAQILELMTRMKEEYGIGFLMITHDLAVVKHIADRVAVMYRGEIVESGTTEEIFTYPTNDYTKKLLAATPIPDPRRRQTI